MTKTKQKESISKRVLRISQIEKNPIFVVAFSFFLNILTLDNEKPNPHTNESHNILLCSSYFDI